MLLFLRLFKLKKLRLSLFIITLALSMSLFMSVLVGSKIVREQYTNAFISSLGYTDFIIKSNSSWCMNSTEITQVLENMGNVIHSYSERLQIWAQVSLTPNFEQYAYLYIVGVDYHSDRYFGEMFLKNGSTDFLLDGEENATLISETLSEIMGLGINDTLHLRMWERKLGWFSLNLTVKGIVRLSKKVYDFITSNPDIFWEVSKSIIVNKKILEKIFGDDIITHVYVHAKVGVDELNNTLAVLRETLGSNYSVCSPKIRLTVEITKSAEQVVRIISLIYSMGFVVSLFVIVNIVYQSLNDWRYNIGLLKVIGYSITHFLADFTLTILFFILISSIIGYVASFAIINIGLIIISNIFSISLFSGFIFEIGLQEYFISLLFGLTVALFSALVPFLIFLRQKPLGLLRFEYLVSPKVHKSLYVLTLIIGLLLSYAGLSAFEQTALLSIDLTTLEQLLIPFLTALVGIVLLVTPIVTVIISILAIPIIFSGKSHILSLAARNLMRDRSKVFFNVILISFSMSFLVAGQILYDSSVYATNQHVFISQGADITLTGIFPSNITNEIAKITHVEKVTAYRKIWNQKIMYNNRTVEYVELYAIISADILDTLYTIKFEEIIDNLTAREALERVISNNHSIILQSHLMDYFGINVGDEIAWITSRGLINLTVIASVSLVAGCWQTIWLEYSLSRKLFIGIVGSNLSQSVYPRFIKGEPIVNSIFVRLDDIENTEIVKKEILKTLWSHDIIPDYVSTAKERIDDNLKYFKSFYVILMTLLVSFIAMSAMSLVTSIAYIIHERRFEIGVLRSIGFSKLNIVQLIILETTIMVIEGAIVGFVVGYYLTAFVISKIPYTPIFPIEFVVSQEAILAIITYVIITIVICALLFTVQITRRSIVDLLAQLRK
ncbi:MAG: ABC transporter permease [Candidatus Odinarchaeota archaeon]|nr:ABC transporter permease [Candidatus Odinarchaeota archaeon]